MSPLMLLSAAVLSPVVFGTAGLLLPRAATTARVALATLGPAATLAALIAFVARFGVGAQPVESLRWLPAFQLNWDLQSDPLSLFFALLVSGIGLLVTLYARAYFGRDDADSLFRFYPSLHLFMTAMIGLALADSFMLLLLFWELTSISSFLLIGWDRDDAQSVTSAMQAFIVTGVGGLVLMAGLILLGLISGAWSFTDLRVHHQDGILPASTLMNAAIVMIFIGAAAKSAQWPLHFWLPGAMAAPTPVSAYLHSATMVKAGVYLVGKFLPTLGAVAVAWWPAMLVGIGAVTMVLGSYVALRRAALKQIFAYTTVSQLGLLVAMYGAGAIHHHDQPNLIWDVTQILNHALYKAPLFLLAGALAVTLGAYDLPELRGLFYRGGRLRLFAIILILALYALAAGPLTISFAAKEFFLYQLAHAYEATRQTWWLVVLAAATLTSIFNVAIFLRFARVLLSRLPRDPAPVADDEHETRDRFAVMLWLPAALLVAMQYVGGIVPGAYEAIFGPIERSRHYFDQFLMTWHARPGLPLYLSLAGFVGGAVLAFAPLLRGVVRDVHDAIYPGFYALATRGGGAVFRVLQTGNFRTYLAITSVMLVLLVLWATRFWPLLAPRSLAERSAATIEPLADLLPGYLFTLFVCVSAILMTFVRARVSRVIVLGMTGFGVSAVFYLYNAPDLALTQISIEIVSLVLFLLVLSLLPPTPIGTRPPRRVLRLTLSLAVGLTMFGLALSGSTGARPAVGYVGAARQRVDSIAEFYFRNAHDAVDVAHRSGGGGHNVVNVILVDFRGFDTLGEIAVLALAAVGVWTLLRRGPRERGTYALRRNLSESRRAPFSARPELTPQELSP